MMIGFDNPAIEACNECGHSCNDTDPILAANTVPGGGRVPDEGQGILNEGADNQRGNDEDPDTE